MNTWIFSSPLYRHDLMFIRILPQGTRQTFYYLLGRKHCCHILSSGSLSDSMLYPLCCVTCIASRIPRPRLSSRPRRPSISVPLAWIIVSYPWLYISALILYTTCQSCYAFGFLTDAFTLIVPLALGSSSTVRGDTYSHACGPYSDILWSTRFQ